MRSLLKAIPLCVATVSFSGDASATQGTRTSQADGSELVSYSALPDTGDYELRENLRLGPDESIPETLFSDIRGIEPYADGRFLVLDYQAQEIRIFAEDGSPAGLLARRGEGPGEIGDANGIQLDAAQTLWINDPSLLRIKTFDASGNADETYPMIIRSYGYIWAGGVTSDDVLVEFPGHSQSPFTREPGVHEILSTVFLKTAKAGSEVADSIPIFESRTTSIRVPRGSLAMPFSPRPRTAISRTGDVWFSVGTDYEVIKTSATGDTLLVIRVDQPAVAVSTAEKEGEIERIATFMERAGSVAVDWDLIPANKQLVRALVVDDEDRLWIRRATADGHVFDVFESDGSLVAVITPGFDTVEYFPPRIRNGAFYAVVVDEFDVPSVARALVPLP